MKRDGSKRKQKKGILSKEGYMHSKYARRESKI